MAERIQIEMPLAEFMARFEEQPFELINQQVFPLPTEIKHHAKVRNMLFQILIQYEQQTSIGEAFSRLLFATFDNYDYVANAYYPDVLFIKSRKDIMVYDDNMPLLIVPDLVVEIISPTDKYTDINTKVDIYLADGVKLIWIVDPQRQTIAVYEGNDIANTLRADDTLTGGTVLPDFELAVKEIFRG